jgi:hypothetical protein
LIFKKVVFIASAVFLAFSTKAQVGEVFPSIETEMISGEKVILPQNFEGKYVLMGIGTSKKAEEDLKTWQQPIYNKFIAKTGIMDDMYNVEVCFIPLFTGTAQMAKSKVIKKLKENNEPMVINHVYIYSGAREAFASVGVDERSEPYFILVDGSGRIVWIEQGHFKQSYFDDVEAILTR